METAFPCVRLGCGQGKVEGRGAAGDPGEARTTWPEEGAAAAAYRPRARGSPREAARLRPSLGPPGPTVELEMADALALGVAGRGAAEAAPQSLGLAALRPPAAAREGYRQQPQAAHARRPLRPLAGPLQQPAACSPRRQRRAGRGGGSGD